jgi:hypothetical protein
VGYDHATGFGVLRAGMDSPPLDVGRRARCRELATVLVAAHGGAGGTSRACVVSRRRFTGWWEYMIDGGLFTAPPRFEHSGAALLDADGKLVGIGSLWVSDALEAGAALSRQHVRAHRSAHPLLDDISPPASAVARAAVGRASIPRKSRDTSW